MKAVRVHEHGEPEVLRYEDVADPEPGDGEALVRLEAVGVNFIDTYRRTGAYPMATPFIPGEEAAGVVEAVGAGVTEVRPGDRVAYSSVVGAYAQRAVVPAARLVPVPPALDSKQAAAALLQGMTAHYLTHSTYPLKPGDLALVHAAAGATGLLLVQIVKRLGARVFGTCSTAEKAQLARHAGADEVILYTEVDFEAEVKRLTGGRGVDVVYDSVGKTTFDQSLSCLRPRGYMVLFGQSSGAVPPLNPQTLNAKGSLFLTRPTLGHYIASREELQWRAGDVFGWAASGELRVRIDSEYPLAEAAEAHRRLQGRGAAGKILLIP